MARSSVLPILGLVLLAGLLVLAALRSGGGGPIDAVGSKRPVEGAGPAAATVPAQGGTGTPFTRQMDGPAATERASTGSGQWIDIDGDEDLDLFVANGYDVSASPVPQPDRLYLNDGTGGLLPVADGPLVSDTAYSSGATWGDYDNDGDPDVFVPAQRGQDNLLYRNEGGGEFTPVQSVPPASDGGVSYAASWVDVDGDGHLDLYVSNGGLSGAAPAFLYRNLGDGDFEQAAAPFTVDSAAALGGSWADYDDDGDPDLFVARRWSAPNLTNALYRNDGEWRFTEVSGSPAVTDTVSSFAAAWGDYDNDGNLDLAVGVRGMNRLYRNDGGGRLIRVTTGGPHVLDGGDTYGIGWADYDNDGDLDLLAANWGSPSFLYTNLGGGRFERRQHGDLGRLETFTGGAAWGDYDGDGDLDLYLANWPNWPGEREANHLYRNDLPPGNHWIGIRLVGTRSNRSALGARIRLRAPIGGDDNAWQIREVAGHTGLRSQDPLRQHFGLGDAERVAEVEVRWPSGLQERFHDLPVDTVVVLTEGQGG